MKLQTLLLFVGIIIAISTFIYIYRKTIPLLFVKFVYGFYSKRFVQTYKRIYNNNPFPHAAKSELIEYIGILQNEKDIPKCSTKKEINYFGHNIGERIKKLEKSEGEPDYFSIREIGKLTVRIYAYDISIYELNAVAMYFILDDIFFFGEIIVRRERQDFNVKKIITPLSVDYCINSEDQKELKICDPKDNKLLILDDGFSVRLKYFNLENNDALSKLFAEQELINNRFTSQKFDDI